jgi:hypothetical protein
MIATTLAPLEAIMPNLTQTDLDAVLHVNDRATHRIVGPAADDVMGEQAVKNAALSCWNWALVGHVGGGVLVNGDAGDIDAVVFPNELYDYVAQNDNDTSGLIHGQITLLTGEPTGQARLEAIRAAYQAHTIDKDTATVRVAALAATLNGLVLSGVPTRYELCMYYQRAEDRPSFEHLWLVVHDNVPAGALPEFDHTGVVVEHFTALVDVNIFAGGQLALHDDGGGAWETWRNGHHVYRTFLDGLHQRQVDKIHNMIVYRQTHVDAGNEIDTRRIPNWARDHWRP